MLLVGIAPYIHGEAATISHSGRAFIPRLEGGTPQVLTLFLLILLSGNKDRIAAEAREVCRSYLSKA